MHCLQTSWVRGMTIVRNKVYSANVDSKCRVGAFPKYWSV
jgi:hypothetical protein